MMILMEKLLVMIQDPLSAFLLMGLSSLLELQIMMLQIIMAM